MSENGGKEKPLGKQVESAMKEAKGAEFQLGDILIMNRGGAVQIRPVETMPIPERSEATPNAEQLP